MALTTSQLLTEIKRQLDLLKEDTSSTNIYTLHGYLTALSDTEAVPYQALSAARTRTVEILRAAAAAPAARHSLPATNHKLH